MNHIGVTLTIWLGTGAPTNRTRIENNYFADRASGSENGYETIRIGTNTRSMQDSAAIVESNYFYRCDGEIEIISNKSGGNIYRYNTFEHCEGQLTLRHGNDCVVEGNFFLGNNNSKSSGVRIIGEDHVVVNNYFENLRETGFRAALANSPLNRYFLVQRALVAFNTFVGCRENLVIGIESSDGDTTLPPLDCVIANNLVKGSDNPLIEYVNTPINMQYEGNIFHGASLGVSQPSGITVIDPLLSVALDGLMSPATNSPAIDDATTNYPIVVDMDGDTRVVGTQDIGTDEASLASPIRGPLTVTDVGPRWTRPSTLRILSAVAMPTNSVVTFEDSTGLAPSYELERRDDFSTGAWSVVAVHVPVAHTSTVSNVSDPSTNGAAGFWRVSRD